MYLIYVIRMNVHKTLETKGEFPKHKDITKVRYASLASAGVEAFASVGLALALAFAPALALLFALALAEIKPTKVSMEGAGTEVDASGADGPLVKANVPPPEPHPIEPAWSPSKLLMASPDAATLAVACMEIDVTSRPVYLPPVLHHHLIEAASSGASGSGVPGFLQIASIFALSVWEGGSE